MSLTTAVRALWQALDGRTLQGLVESFASMRFGSMLRSQSFAARRVAPVASPYELATLVAYSPPDDQRAAAIQRVYVRAGSATGEFTIVAANTTPTTTQAAVSATGAIVFLGTDAPTDVDIEYTVEKQDVIELTLPVSGASGLLVIPAGFIAKLNPKGFAGGVVSLIEAEALVGTTIGKEIVSAPAAGLPATGHARLDVAKQNVQFAAADVVTSARVKLGIAYSIDPNAVLSAATQII